jgi:hypothetical protein
MHVIFPSPYNNKPHLAMSLIKGDSLLSNISNVSVLIKPGDGSSVFNFSLHHHSYDQDQS